MFCVEHEKSGKVDSPTRSLVTRVPAEQGRLDGGWKVEEAELEEGNGKVNCVAGELLTRAEQEVNRRLKLAGQEQNLQCIDCLIGNILIYVYMHNV